MPGSLRKFAKRVEEEYKLDMPVLAIEVVGDKWDVYIALSNGHPWWFLQGIPDGSGVGMVGAGRRLVTLEPRKDVLKRSGGGVASLDSLCDVSLSLFDLRIHRLFVFLISLMDGLSFGAVKELESVLHVPGTSHLGGCENLGSQLPRGSARFVSLSGV